MKPRHHDRSPGTPPFTCKESEKPNFEDSRAGRRLFVIVAALIVIVVAARFVYVMLTGGAW